MYSPSYSPWHRRFSSHHRCSCTEFWPQWERTLPRLIFPQWKRVLPTLFSLILTACSAPATWQRDSVNTCYKAPIQRLRSRVDNIYRGIQLELLTVSGQTRAHLNTFCLPLSLEPGSELIAVTFSWDNQQRVLELPLLTGGQSVLLTPEITHEVLHALTNGHCVEISMGRYRDTLSATGFPSLPLL